MKRIKTLLLTLILLALTLTSCGTNNTNSNQITDEKSQNNSTEYKPGIYENIAENNDTQVGSKLYFDCQLDASGIIMHDIERGYTYYMLDLGEDQYISFPLNVDPISRVESSNLVTTELEKFYGEPGRFFLQYLGKEESGLPICSVDYFEIQNKTYKIGELISIKGNMKNPALKGENLNLDLEYNGSLGITLTDALVGQDAINIIGKTNSEYIPNEDKKPILVKFKVSNTGLSNVPVEINKYMFKYSKDDYVAKDLPIMYGNVENELNFTLYDGIKSEGWIGFEVEEDATKIYLILDDVLWFTVI